MSQGERLLQLPLIVEDQRMPNEEQFKQIALDSFQYLAHSYDKPSDAKNIAHNHEESQSDDVPLENLDLSVRTYNVLKRRKINYLKEAQLIYHKIESGNAILYGLGQKGLSELKDKLFGSIPKSLSNAQHSNKLEDEESEEISSNVDNIKDHANLWVDQLAQMATSQKLIDTSIKVLNLKRSTYLAIQENSTKRIESIADLCRLLYNYEISGSSVFIRGFGLKRVAELKKSLVEYFVSQSSQVVQEQANSSTDPLGAVYLEIPQTVAQSNLFQSLISKLDERGQKVIQARFGLSDGNSRTLSEISELLTKNSGESSDPLTRERIRQIEMRALIKLSHCSEVHSIEKKLITILEELGGFANDEDLTNRLMGVWPSTMSNPIGYVELIENILNKNRRKSIKHSRILKERIWILDSPEVLLDKVFSYLSNVLNDVMISNSDFCSISVLTELIRKRNDCPPHISEDIVRSFTRIHPNIITTEDGRVGLERWGKNKSDLCLFALRKIGTPAHFREITKVVNTLIGSGEVVSEGYVHNIVQSNKEIFAYVDQGTYGLCEWGLTKVNFYPDIIEQVLEKAGCPLTKDIVYQEVCKIRNCKESSITMYLTMGHYGRFKSFPNNRYGLSEWSDDKFADLDYRETIFVNDIQNVSNLLYRKPKLSVQDQLNNVDNFFNLEKAQ